MEAGSGSRSWGNGKGSTWSQVSSICCCLEKGWGCGWVEKSERIHACPAVGMGNTHVAPSAR